MKEIHIELTDDGKKIKFDNGRAMSPGELVQLIVRLRKTGSRQDINDVLRRQYRFTDDDVVRFSYVLEILKEI